MTDDSSFIRKEPCPACGSRDNLARYSDGHAYCFGCGHYEPGDGSSTSTHRRPRVATDVFYEGDFQALTKRGLSEETCRKFGYKIGTLRDGRKVQLAPYYRDGVLVATKVRPKDKDEMFSTGDMSGVELFGQHLWGQGGKKVVVTEGEIDAMTVSQMQGNKWPVVSVPKGSKAARKSLAENIEWLSSFEEVILMFDMDAPGQEAVADCAPLFKPGKVKVAKLPLKDPNECLTEGKGDAIISAIWNAQAWRPDGVVRVHDILEEALRDPEMGFPWWSETLTAATYGRRLGELYAFGAGTGIGKTDWFTQQMSYDVQVLGEKIGIFSLEQMPAETLKRLAGKFAKKTFHIPDGSWEKQDLANVLHQMDEEDRVRLYDNFGATEWDVIATTIRYLAHAEGIRIFYLDHLTALAAAEDDEKKALERIMAEMGSLVKELGIIIHFISHLATPDGAPHEEGGRVMIRHFKGSRAIGYWCAFMFGLERNQQHDDERWRSITTFRVLKDRNTGRSTGQVIYLGYEQETGMLFETDPPEDDAPSFKDESRGLNDPDCPF